MTAALETLAAEIRHARELGFNGFPERWDELAQTALAEIQGEWLPERDFRYRTGASDKWCRKHFAEYEANNMARKRGRFREWHVHARLPVKRRTLDGIERDIINTHRAA